MDMIKPRNYQLEMLEESLERNIIVAMDTGSGKTQIAILRIMVEVERCPLEKIIWFLAPTVSLCVQQHEVISAQLPAIQTRQLTGADQVDRWGSQLIWDSALKGVRVVISTHAVLCDALTHGFVRMEQLALIVFDEAHHCTKRHPGNRIMRDFYHPMHLEEQHVPHILGLTASPIMRSNVGEIRKIESNLNAITRTPQKERKELMCYVHRPAIIKLPFQHNTTSSSKCLLLLASFLQESVTDKGRQALEKFYRQTCVMSVDLGPWAADFFVTTAVRQLSKEVKQERSIGNYFLDPLKTTLMDLLSGLLNVSPVPLISSNISDRVRRLLGFLQLENEKDFSGIIFVRERVKAYVLTELLSQHPETRGRFRSAPFVGESNGGKDAYSFWEKNNLREQTYNLERFRKDQTNLIIATSVLEEGIDVSSCHVVISFDPPDNLKSFIQRRGRARQKFSKFVIMIPEGVQDWISKWRALEEEMVRMYADQKRVMEKQEYDASERMPHEFRLKNGALLNGGSAISHLHHFCGRLPRERFVDRRPVFAIKSIEGQGLLQATVTLPSCVEPGVRISTGVGWWRTERVAKQEAALNACVALYRAGLINDNFLPVCQDKLPIEKDLVAKSRVEVDVRTDPWLRISQAWSSSGQCFHQLRVSFSENGLDRPDLAIILTSPVSLPPWPTLNLHWGSDLCFVSKSTSLPFPASFSESELELMQQATRILTQSVQGNQAADKALDYLILCTPDIPRLHLQGWIKRYSGSRTLENYPQNRDIASFGLIRHACLFRPHRLHRWFQSDPESELLFECHPFPRRRNLFHQGQSSKVVKADESNCRTKIVSAKSAHIDLLPWELARIGGFLPTIISHIRVLKMAEGLRQRVIAAVPLNDLELIATAIVAPSAQWVANYQRLEFLGDSVLKYATCIHLFQAHSTWHEGYLSQRKSHLVSNTSLLNAAFRLGLISFLLNDTLVKRKQLLPTISNCIQDERNARQIRVRSAADVVESLIGAAFVEGGVRKAYKMIHLFIPDIPSDMGPFNSPTGSGGSHLNGDVQKLISRLMGYSFHKNQILLEGLTHPSWERDLSPSYQRLEFLGDAILDMIVTRLLFERCPGLSESRMSKIRAAVVNADFLAYLCMDFAVLEDTTHIVERKKGHFEPVADTRRVELWKFMRHHNPDITHAQNTCLNRFSRLQSRINIALNQQRRHPWALLAELEAEKFYSDLVESLVGAVFVDSSGSLSCCEEFLIQIGLVSYLDRILDDEIDVEHPRAVLSHITPDKEVNYLFGCDPLGSHSVTVIIQGEAVAHVEECRSRAEAVLRGADEAAQKLRIASLGRSISQVII